MLNRLTASAALMSALLFAGCRTHTEAQAATDSHPTPAVAAVEPPASPLARDPETPPEAVSSAHGSKWQDPDEDAVNGGFAGFKEAWVYADGKPVGVIREVELPPIPEVWIDQVEDLDFKAGDPGPHERIYQVRRWRLSDYFKAVGVDVSRIKAVILHAGKGVVEIDGPTFRKYARDTLFDLTGNNNLKLRVFFPDGLMKRINNTYDRYAAISVIVDKQVPTLTKGGTLEQDGVELSGIPYYGQPLRGGIRVYLDGRLAMVIKRNSLGTEGKVADGTWNLGQLLAAHKVDVAKIGAIDVVDPNQVVTRLDAGTQVDAITFTGKSQAQGAVLLSTGQTTNALELWSKGKVAVVHQASPSEREKK
jgi:hypothetical protein